MPIPVYGCRTVYWIISHHNSTGRIAKKVKYDTLATWWADTVRHSHTKLYIGVALYKVGQPSQAESDWALEGGVPELKRQLDLNDALPEISGTILFREAFLRQPQTEEAVKYLKSRWRN